MSSLFLMRTITDRRTTDAFSAAVPAARGVNVTLRTVGTGTAVRRLWPPWVWKKTEKGCAAGGGDSRIHGRRSDRPAPQNAHRRAGHRHCIHRAAEQHRRKRALMFLTEHQP